MVFFNRIGLDWVISWRGVVMVGGEGGREPVSSAMRTIPIHNQLSFLPKREKEKKANWVKVPYWIPTSERCHKIIAENVTNTSVIDNYLDVGGWNCSSSLNFTNYNICISK
jgi:hypothetical protein